MSYKQIILVRSDLKMKPGKLAAQVAHASCSCLTTLLFSGRPKDRELVNRWLSSGQTKIVLKVDSEAELNSYHGRALGLGITSRLTYDEGRTAFHGQATLTCCGIGPFSDEMMDSITSSLKLL